MYLETDIKEGILKLRTHVLTELCMLLGTTQEKVR